jgi:glycosyltransferase involved in cell wall biosynthesis
VVDDNDPASEFRRDTELLMQQYDSNPAVKYIKHSANKNGAAARNTGIVNSTGEYIAFLDDDDMFLPTKLEEQLAYISSHPQFDAVYCLIKHPKNATCVVHDEGDLTKDILLLKGHMYTPTLLFRREALRDIKGFDESFIRHQDYDLMLRYFKSGRIIGCVSNVLTEIGYNKGENIPEGERLEQMKALFFAKFMPYIDDIDRQTPGFKNKVLATHYAGVFLSHIKHKHFLMALKTLFKYWIKNPRCFSNVIYRSIQNHI